MLKKLNYPLFKVTFKNPVSGEDLRNLRKFYTPLLGSHAIILYEYLRDLTLSQNDNGYHDFNMLQHFLNLSAEDLNQARNKLEAVSLLTVFEDEFKQISLLRLETPLNNKTIKKNFALKNKLIKLIGKENFKKLTEEYILRDTETTHLKDVSANYNDVFNEDEEFDFLFNTQELQLVQSEFKTIESSLNNQKLPDLKYKNIYEALIKDSSENFYAQLTKTTIDQETYNLINKAYLMGFNDQCINLVFYYAYEINNKKINCAYVEKILNDFYEKDVTDFNVIESYLDNVMASKNTKVGTSKALYKTSYILSLQKEEESQTLW
ncbi:DnaD domain protein [Mycoplasmopsis columbina]|uniref:DnaD domain-containing protein n=1 Tax=Mycoplasmopsis columbina SF7 TaxID=1037410 RepID=F9UKR2_9BACT|nr:DnaD domain protein [Mycoplasmopsis columbina]EGV00267.1 hypothetical protein MCSF7_02376 [Mycoplasmopsis columbina SF7]VEU77156.1 DnaD domain-containing protein [Mycoplasmopsis columbina]